MIAPTTSPVLFFDGVCNLCNGVVQFILKHDKKKIFLFAPLQSEAGKEAIEKATPIYKHAPDSVILFYKGKWYTRSSAALQVFRLLGFPWSLLFAGIIFPVFLRDPVYNFISRHRYKWFGKRSECMLPAPGVKERFLSW